MIALNDLQESLRDTAAFTSLDDFRAIGSAFLELRSSSSFTKIISPTPPNNYFFYQFDEHYRHAITRPLNSSIFIESPVDFDAAFIRFCDFLDDVKKHHGAASLKRANKKYCDSGQINQVIYTIQQSIGCIGDSFENTNQSRKRVGQLFEALIKLILQQTGLRCESRTIQLPIPNHQDMVMPYELDVVFSVNRAIIASESTYVHQSEIIGSIKTTSKDRVDKVFLEKFLISQLLGRDVPVVAIFLHDVQRAVRGNSIFGVASTFKSNHFVGYTITLNKLDGVYYVDPRPEMKSNPILKEHIFDFQQFLAHDLWTITKR